MARKVIDVRIVNAATAEQESFIKELSMKLFHDVFPLYFSELDIQRFKKKGVLSLNNNHDYQGTLKEAFQIMACLQMIHIILTKPSPLNDVNNQAVFEKNSKMLNDFGINFPFAFSDFELKANQAFSDYRRLV
ncbi:YhcU family protein [Bacillus vallismortis]|uniref:YhcU family protein n=1 Tax=Bacillus vallismortis TaxID=72361 RepID=UPI00228126C7|nr:YhcU family protein [Bacillus vallismortis]MCI3984393.1 YhcU family protein [Bacillus vallismortis]MCI4136082.1 YhcU family protein [Bacillus vallismortis]MCY7893236.1 YhcU family protein [Bacillus vallismortis]